MGVGRTDHRDAGFDREPDMRVSQVDAVGQAVDLDRLPVAVRRLEYGLDVDRVRRPPADVAAGRMAERRDVRVLERADRPGGQLLARLPLPTVDACLNPVELGQDVVWEIELAVRPDVALDPGEDAQRRQPL